MLISIVLPFYNNLESLRRGIGYLESNGLFSCFNLEIIIVDDGSDNPSDLASYAKKKGYKLVRSVKNEGKGSALAKGVAVASGDYTAFLDSDIPFKFQSIKSFLEVLLDKKPEILISTRNSCLENKVKTPFLRFYLSKVFGFLSSAFLGLKLEDNQCGLKGFRTDISKQLFLNTIVKRFAIDAEILFRAKNLGHQWEQHPVEIRDNGLSSINVFRDGIKMLKDLIKIRFLTLKSLEKTPLKNILNCDDYGLNRSVSRAILDLAQAKKITSISLMSTHCKDQEYLQIKKLEDIKVGLHLNLTEGKCVSNKNDIKSLVDKNGEFFGLKLLLLKLACFQVSQRDISKEISSQLDRALVEGIKISHVDGHQHIQYLPFVYKSLIAELKKKIAPRVRIRIAPIRSDLFSVKYFLINLSRLLISNAQTDYSQVVDYSTVAGVSKKKQSLEYILHVAHPAEASDYFKKDSFSVKNRISQFKKAMKGDA